MPSVCVCDCGLDVEDGRLCLDWATVGMKRVCATAEDYRSQFESNPEFVLLRDVTAQWANETCRTHRVIARMDVPWVQIRVGPGNGWYVRGYLDGAINATPPPNATRLPDMQWATNWYLAMPAGTDQEQQAPGSVEAEFLVPPGDTVVVAGRMWGRTANYVQRPTNSLAVAAYQVSLSAWPAHPDTGSGRTCV